MKIYSRKIFSKRLKGGALYVAIVISIVIGVFVSLLLWMSSYNQRRITDFGQWQQLKYNLEGAFQIAQSDYFTPENNLKWQKNDFDNDSFRVQRKSWGAYLLITCEVKNRHNYLHESGIYGTWMTPDTGLIVADNSRPAGASGSVTLRSKCYVPQGGLKPSYVNGTAYVANVNNKKHLKQSPYSIPAVKSSYVFNLKQQRAGLNDIFDSLTFSLESTDQSFLNKSIIYNASSIVLKNISLRNNIVIRCNEVIVESSAQLDNILIVCDKIKFSEGYRGTVHVIASDSITMGKNCRFYYPSSFVLLPESPDEKGLRYISLNEDCMLSGGIIAIGDNTNAHSPLPVFVKLHARSRIAGLVYSSDYIHIEGVINATVMCNKLLIKSPSAVYENMILGCDIDPAKYSHLLSVPEIFENNNYLFCCRKI